MEAFMVYRVEHWKAGEKILDAAWIDSLPSLQAQAVRDIEHGYADRIEVFTESGERCFQCPRQRSTA
ncbi:MAG: hypothetical protein CL820_13800 [Croceicoccus sp.]|nr:hypothetical protein [Croceicoccus sp.]MAL26934.1 hypothetical protein [Croceicoccus sp.]|tara:strand:- start:19952 stop:20152 length:201 start_codon:yes stop_codon:yes gene_type:complete